MSHADIVTEETVGRHADHPLAQQAIEYCFRKDEFIRDLLDRLNPKPSDSPYSKTHENMQAHFNSLLAAALGEAFDAGWYGGSSHPGDNLNSDRARKKQRREYVNGVL